jgi:hypothetical protein
MSAVSTPPVTSSPAKPTVPEHKIMFQKWFKSVGPRTYAAQLKKARNGNHFLVLSEGKRDETTGEVRKISLFIFSEDFSEFFKMLHETAVFVREHPVPDDVKKRQARRWAKQNAEVADRKQGSNRKGMPDQRHAATGSGHTRKVSPPPGIDRQDNRSAGMAAVRR